MEKSVEQIRTRISYIRVSGYNICDWLEMGGVLHNDAVRVTVH